MAASLTDDGGVAAPMINKTGSASVKGTVVFASAANDNSFVTNTAQYEAIGVVYEAGKADGASCLVTKIGKAYVLLKDTTAATRGTGYVAIASATAGRAEVVSITNPVQGSAIGHPLETKSSGTNVLCLVDVHLNYR